MKKLLWASIQAVKRGRVKRETKKSMYSPWKGEWDEDREKRSSFLSSKSYLVHGPGREDELLVPNGRAQTEVASTGRRNTPSPPPGNVTLSVVEAWRVGTNEVPLTEASVPEVNLVTRVVSWTQGSPAGRVQRLWPVPLASDGEDGSHDVQLGIVGKPLRSLVKKQRGRRWEGQDGRGELTTRPVVGWRLAERLLPGHDRSVQSVRRGNVPERRLDRFSPARTLDYNL